MWYLSFFNLIVLFHFLVCPPVFVLFCFLRLYGWVCLFVCLFFVLILKVSIKRLLWQSKDSIYYCILLLLFSLTYLLIFSTDTDEYETTPQKCHVNAAFNSTHPSYTCKWKPGYVEDGRNCTGTVNSVKNLWYLF